MALAILDLIGVDDSSVQLSIDTGTNRYYQVKVGRSVQQRSGLDWVDEVVFATPVKVNETGGGLLDTSMTISIPSPRLERGKGYAQLFSFKTREGQAPAFSRVVALDRALRLPPPDYSAPESSEMQEVMDRTVTLASFERPRSVACRTCTEQFTQAPTLSDLLAQIARVAAPAAQGLLEQVQGNGRGPSVASGNGSAALPSHLAGLVQTILKTIPGVGETAFGAQQPMGGMPDAGNRFVDGAPTPLSRPFIFGVDDALFGAVIGQVIQILPQLMNSANEKRVQLQQANNKLVTDLLSDVNRRMLLEQVLQAQRQAPAGAPPGQADNLAGLAALLEKASVTTNGKLAAAPGPAPAAAPGPSAAGAASAQSLYRESGPPTTLSSRAVVSFVTGDPVARNGTNQVLFSSGQPIQIRIKLVVAEPVPKTALPKAIVKILLKDATDQSVAAEKVVKQENLLPNEIVTIPFAAPDLAGVPADVPLALLAEVRWLGSKGRAYRAMGSTDVTFVGRTFLEERGPAVGPERELHDMNRFRPFWNKVWETPPLDAASDGGGRRLWALDANLKYSMLVDPDEQSNGLMETRLLLAPKDPDSVADRTEGRMKGGIELSVVELSKLAPLWAGEAVLPPGKVEAFRTWAFAQATSSELVYRLRLKGRSGERGLIWVVPVFRLAEFTLASVESTDEAGQVTSVSKEKVRFPLPVAARVIGLKSE